MVRRIATDSEFTLSDHKPKTMTIIDEGPKCKKSKERRNVRKIDWQKLENRSMKLKFQEEMRKSINAARQKSNKDISWEWLSRTLEEVGEKTAGLKMKESLNPCFDGHEREISTSKDKIMTYTERMQNAESEEQKRLYCRKRREVRNNFKKVKKQWETEWWEKKIKDCKEAEKEKNTGKLYKLLKEIGVKDMSKGTMQEEFFKPEEYRRHFEKVSTDRFERTMEEIEEVKDSIPQIKDFEKLKRAEEMEKEISRNEFQNEVMKIKNGAPGEDGVLMNVLKQAGEETMNCTLEIVQRMHRSDADSWEREIKTGLMVPLHKKGDRKEIDNYRGVCLLSMVSRILARIMATRLRSWIEDI